MPFGTDPHGDAPYGDSSSEGAVFPSIVTDDALTTDSCGGGVVLARPTTDTALTTDTLFDHAVSVSDTALTTDAVGVGKHFARLSPDVSYTTDGLLGPIVFVSVRCLTRVVVSVACYRPLPPPQPVPGPSGLHDYEVITCDQFGVAYGEIVTAVPTQIDWDLDDLGSVLIDIDILDPSLLNLLPQSAIPAVREIQIWRDQSLIFWGLPISATYDASQVHLTCSGHLWFLSTRNFGPVITEYLTNPQFEQGFLDWVPVGVTSSIEDARAGGIVALGRYAARLTQSSANEDTYIHQILTGISAPPEESTFFDLAAWLYIDPAYASPGPALDQRGLFIQSVIGSTVQDFEFETITASTVIGQWVRLETGILVEAGTTVDLDIRLYAPGGSVIWDAVQLTVEESVGSTLAGSDVYFIILEILQYAQDPTRGKSNVNLPVIGANTGVVLQRNYQFSDNGGILDALNEFPTIGACDFEVTYDETGHFRGFQVFSPAKGSVKYNAAIEMDLGQVTDLQGAVDGSQVGTAVRYLGQGSTGSSAEIGFANFPCYLGGRVSGVAVLVQGSTTAQAGDIDFTALDVGQGIYCQTPGVIPVGTVIVEVLSATEAVMSNPSAITANPSVIGIGGIIIDSVQSAMPDQMIDTLQASAEQMLALTQRPQNLPTPKMRADGPAGLFGKVETGDVLPVMFNYGWCTFGPVYMRLVTLTLYPPTEELEFTLNLPGTLSTVGGG